MGEMIIFYTTGCPKCAVLKKKLDSARIQYEVCDDLEEMKALGLKSAPALRVGSETLDFGSAVKWVNSYVLERIPSD